MRNVLMAIFLLLTAGLAHGGQSCLHVLSEVNGVFCPKCSDPGASSRMAAKKVGPGMCLSCQFYCWYTATPGGGEYTYVPTSAVEEPGCLPTDPERERVLAQSIPLALHMGRADFARLAGIDPAAAATIASMLWRGEESSMTDARQFMAQYKSVPSYENAMDLFEAYDEHIALPFATPIPGRDFLHVEVNGERIGDDAVRLPVSSSIDAKDGRTPTHEPITREVHLTHDEVATSFAGQLVIARHAWASFP